MDSSKKRVLLLVSIFLVPCLFFAYLYKDKSRDETMPLFIRLFSENRYEIVKVIASSGEPDASVEFVVKIEGKLKIPADFQKAEHSDLKDFKSRMIGRGLLDENDMRIGRMVLYRGDAILGPRTFCADFSCSAYVMNARGDSRIYMAVYKN